MKKSGLIFLAVIVLCSCNKEKRLMNRLTANWNIEESTFTIIDRNGNDIEEDKVTNAGKLMIYDEDPENPSKESKLYDLNVLDEQGDTIFYIVGGTLVTDEKNNRMIMKNALNDSTYQSDLIWTIVKERKNRQTWTTFGVDSTMFYPENNHNPSAANNWIDWTLELKRE